MGSNTQPPKKLRAADRKVRGGVSCQSVSPLPPAGGIMLHEVFIRNKLGVLFEKNREIVKTKHQYWGGVIYITANNIFSELKKMLWASVQYLKDGLPSPITHCAFGAFCNIFSPPVAFSTCREEIILFCLRYQERLEGRGMPTCFDFFEEGLKLWTGFEFNGCTAWKGLGSQFES